MSTKSSPHWVRWTLILLVLAGLASGIWRAMQARKASQSELAASTASAQGTVLELAASDLLTLSTRQLAAATPISGTLKATRTAQVKARVPGELRDLVVREGDAVAAGQVLARIDPLEYQARLAQAREQAQAARAQVDIAQRAYDNNRALVQQGFISPTALDTSSANLAAAQASYRAARAAEDVAAKALEDTTLRAPIGGQIAQRLAQPGERVMTDARIVEIVDNRELELEVSLAATDALQLHVGQTAALGVEGGAGLTRARVARINPAASATNRAVLAYLSVPPAPGLRHGLFVQGSLESDARATPALPLNAVRTDKPRPYVQWVQQGKVLHQSVELGDRGPLDGATWVEVRGLPLGAQVLSGTVGLLREGTAVRSAAAASAPAKPASAS